MLKKLLCIILLATISVSLMSNTIFADEELFDSNTKVIKQVDDKFLELYNEFQDNLDGTGSNYISLKGFYLSKAKEFAASLLDSNKIQGFTDNDSSVIIKHKTGLLSCFSLRIENGYSNSSTGYEPSEEEIAPVSTITTGDKALSDINIRIFQPFLNEMDETRSDDPSLPDGLISDAQCPVAPIKTLQASYGALIKTTRTYNKPISLEDIKSLGPNQIIIFSGHGTWMGPEIHSTILTGKAFDYDEYQNNPLYRQDCYEGRIVDDVGNEAITIEYIKKYCPNLNNSFVFLGICQGAYHLDGEEDADKYLVNAFLNKGAAAVFGYSQTTDMRYSNVLVYTIIKDLGEEKTLNEALLDATNKYGQTDSSVVHSKPLVFYKTGTNDFSIDANFNCLAPLSINYTFDGQEKTGVLSGVGYTLSGQVKETNVGNYEATATLLEGFKWPDTESLNPKTMNWSISKASVTDDDLIPNNVEIKYDTKSHDLINIRNPKLGKYYFRLEGETSYSEEIPKAINVGTYKIEWYFVGEPNANNIGNADNPISYTTRIVKGTRPQMEARLSDYYYGKDLPTPYLTKDVEQEANVEYYYFKSGDFYNHHKWENMTSTTLDVDTYNIYAVIGETANYEASETYDSEFKVLKYIPKKDYTVPNTGIKH